MRPARARTAPHRREACRRGSGAAPSRGLGRLRRARVRYPNIRWQRALENKWNRPLSLLLASVFV